VGFVSPAQRVLLKNLTTFDDKRLHFGFTLGINTTDFVISHYTVMGDNPKFSPEVVDKAAITSNTQVRADVAKLTPGFTVGIVTNLRVSESFDLRFLPGMSFGERKLTYNIPIAETYSNGKGYYSIKSTFLDFPLLLKYKSRKMNNQRPYIIGGGAIRVDISKSGQEDLVRLKPFDTYIETGIGWDSYLQFFRLSTELKFSFGLNNILDTGPKSTVPQVYSSAFTRVASNVFTLCFHFE
jgi:hypothetical protein